MGTGDIQMDRVIFMRVPALAKAQTKAQRGREGREETSVAGIEERSQKGAVGPTLGFKAQVFLPLPLLQHIHLLLHLLLVSSQNREGRRVFRIQ